MALVAPSNALRILLQLVHVLVKPMAEEGHALMEKLQRYKRVEHKLVAMATYLGKHAQLYLMKATIGEQLPEGLECSNIGILISKKAIRVIFDKRK